MAFCETVTMSLSMVAHLQGDVSGHDLRRGGGIHDFVRVFFKKHLARVRLDQDGAAGVEHVLVENIRVRRIPCDRIRRERRRDKALRFGRRILRQNAGRDEKRRAEQQRKQALGQSFPSVI